MGDERDAARPEPRIVGRPGNLAAEFGGELAEYGRDIDPDLLEHPSVHDRHRAAAAARPLPVGADKAPRLHLRRVRPRIIILDRLERRANPFAQCREPRNGLLLPVRFGHGGPCGRRWAPPTPPPPPGGGGAVPRWPNPPPPPSPPP